MTEAQVQTGGMNEWGRLTGIFWAPKSVFQNLVLCPRFWVPLLLLTALSIVYLVSFSQVVGFETLIQRQMDASPRVQELSAEQREQAMEMAMKFSAPVTYVSTCIALAVMTLLVSVVLLACFNFLGGAELKFKQAFSITCYSFLPMSLSTILSMVVMFLKDPADFDLQNPLPLNVGAFLSTQDTPTWLRTLTSSVDFFAIWVILLLALGFSVAGGRRMSFGKALMLVVLPWMVAVLGRAALAGLFS